MRLGTSSPLAHSSPAEWAENQISLGCSSAVFPVQSNEPEEKIIAYKDAADKAGLEECAPGQGEFPLKYYVDKMNEIDNEMPIILEHLNSDEDYIKYMNYLRTILI